MTWQSFMRALMLVSNLGIAGCYAAMSAVTFPGVNPLVWDRLRLNLWRTRISGCIFFMSCAATHLELYLHTMAGGMTSGDMSSGHMVVIHVVQLAAAFVFLLGILKEVRESNRNGRSSKGGPE